MKTPSGCAIFHKFLDFLPETAWRAWVCR